jgi:nucleotide-binding universal stress UspA family protein
MVSGNADIGGGVRRQTRGKRCLGPCDGLGTALGRAKLTLIREHAINRIGALGTHITYTEATGDPAHALQEAAFRHAAMMVVVGIGAGTSSPLTRLLSRGVTKSLLRHLECPVLLVPLPR